MGLMQKLGNGLRSFLEERLVPPLGRTIQGVVELVMEGRTAEALAWIEREAGITPALYEDRLLLGQRLRERLAGADPNWAALFVRILAWTLWKSEQPVHGATVLETDFGIDVEDYKAPVRLAERLQARLAPLDPNVAVQHVQMMAEILGMIDRENERLAIWEADLRIQRDCGQVESVKAVRRRLDGVLPEAASIYVVSLWAALFASGRRAEAIAILHDHLGIEEEDYQEPSRLRHKIRGHLQPLDNTSASLVLALCGGLEEQEKGLAVLVLIEGLLDLEPGRYADSSELAVTLRSRLGSLLPGLAWNIVSTLTVALVSQERNADALVLCWAAVEFAFGGKRDLACVGGLLRAHRDAFAEERLVLFTGAFAIALMAAEDARSALALLEGFAGIGSADYASLSALTSRLSVTLETWHAGMIGGFFSSLAHALDAAGDDARMGLLTEVYVGNFLQISDGDVSVAPGQVFLFDSWLERFGHDGCRRPVEVCGEFVRYLRRNLATRGGHLRDRTDFINSTSSLRRRIVETGLFWAQQESDPETARRISIKVQLWDAELAQRLLIERFLLEPILPVPLGKPPIQGWPWGSEVDRPESRTHLPDPALGSCASGTLEERIEARSPPRDVSGVANRLQQEHPELFQRARDIILQGVDQARLAEAIGKGGLLLRGTFGSRGQLLWLALRSDGRGVEASGRGMGAPGDLERLRWAAARHDFRMAWVRFRADGRKPGIVVRVRNEVDQALGELVCELGSLGNPQDLASRLDWVFQRFLSPDRSGYGTLLRLLIPACSPLRAAPGPDIYDAWAGIAAEQLRDFRDRLHEEAPARLQPELDRITADYIGEVREVWNLDPLSEILSPDMDLVVQLDDALHTVPIAHLPVAGQPLFQRVGSIRSSLALLMTSLQLQAEQEVRREGVDAERLLSVSYFGQEEQARRAVTGAAWLHHGFSVLGESHGLEVYGAADDPAGSVGLLRAALEELRRFRVLAICGHGDLFRSGIALAGGDEEETTRCLWDGGGCDLSGVEWLCLVSCSLGRVGQNGDRDVEGFCVRLALHRARAVTAFRWPVHSVQAVALVNESVRLYLESLRSGGDAGRHGLRARALNDARKIFFGDGVNPPLHPHVGLNTAAACELFGLG